MCRGRAVQIGLLHEQILRKDINLLVSMIDIYVYGSIGRRLRDAWIKSLCHKHACVNQNKDSRSVRKGEKHPKIVIRVPSLRRSNTETIHLEMILWRAVAGTDVRPDWLVQGSARVRNKATGCDETPDSLVYRLVTPGL